VARVLEPEAQPRSFGWDVRQRRFDKSQKAQPYRIDISFFTKNLAGCHWHSASAEAGTRVEESKDFGAADGPGMTAKEAKEADSLSPITATFS